MKLTLILYKWSPGPLNLLIIQIKTCFPSPEVTVFFLFGLGLSQTENGKKNEAQYPSNSFDSYSILKPISIFTGGSKNHSSTVLR